MFLSLAVKVGWIGGRVLYNLLSGGVLYGLRIWMEDVVRGRTFCVAMLSLMLSISSYLI